MLTHYLVLAVKVLLRRKFFTFISLFGISFTLLVLTVVAALFDHSFGPGAEEPRQDRTLYAERAVMYGPNSTWSSNARLQAARSLRAQPAGRRAAVAVRELTHRALATSTAGRSSSALEADRRRVLAHPRVRVPRRRTDSARPTSPRRDSSRSSTARRASASSTAATRVGQTLEADGQRFRVIGVVEDVSETAQRAVRRHLGALHHGEDRRLQAGDHGRLECDGAGQGQGVDGRHPRRVQLAAAPRRAAGSKDYEAIVAPFETKFAGFARMMPTADRKDPESQVWRLVALLLVPRRCSSCSSPPSTS